MKKPTRKLLALRVPIETIEKYKQMAMVLNQPYQTLMVKALQEFSALSYTENCFTPVIVLGEKSQ